MHIPLVMTVIGRDRPGLVELVAKVVAGHGGNWMESRMSRLGGEFAGIVLVEIPAAEEQALRDELAELSAQGLTVVAVKGKPELAQPLGSRQYAVLDIVGHDRPGIVRDVSEALARAGANVEEMTTTCESAPMSGEPLFRAGIKLALPEGSDLTAIRAELEKIAANLLVDVTLEPVSG